MVSLVLSFLKSILNTVVSDLFQTQTYLGLASSKSLQSFSLVTRSTPNSFFFFFFWWWWWRRRRWRWWGRRRRPRAQSPAHGLRSYLGRASSPPARDLRLRGARPWPSRPNPVREDRASRGGRLVVPFPAAARAPAASCLRSAALPSPPPALSAPAPTTEPPSPAPPLGVAEAAANPKLFNMAFKVLYGTTTDPSRIFSLKPQNYPLFFSNTKLHILAGTICVSSHPSALVHAARSPPESSPPPTTTPDTFTQSTLKPQTLSQGSLPWITSLSEVFLLSVFIQLISAATLWMLFYYYLFKCLSLLQDFELLMDKK